MIFDTFALVKLLKKEKGWELVRSALQKGGMISEATLYELEYVVTRDYLDQKFELQQALRKAQEISGWVEIDLKKVNLSQEITQHAINFKIRYNKLNLSHFDCLGLSTAYTLQVPLFS